MSTRDIIVKSIQAIVDNNLLSGKPIFHMSEFSEQPSKDESGVYKYRWSTNYHRAVDGASSVMNDIHHKVFIRTMDVINEEKDFTIHKQNPDTGKIIALSEQEDILNLSITDNNIYLIIIESGQW